MKCFFHLSAITVMAVGLACFVGCEPQPKTPGEKLDKAIDNVQEAGEELSREAQEAAGEIRDEFKPRPPVDINVGGQDGIDINVGDKAAPAAGAIDVEVGDGDGVQIDVKPRD